MADIMEKNTDKSLIASDKVEGTVVYNPQNERLGTVANIMIDKQSGKADYAVLKFGGLFGLGSDHYPIPWDMLNYDTEKGGYIVDITKEQLTDAPRYGTDDTPEYNDDYGRTVYGYYGVGYPMM